MKHFKLFLAICILFLFVHKSFCQVDTIRVNQYFEKALAFEKAKQTDSAIVYYNKTSNLALILPENYKTWGIEKHLTCLNNLATVYINNWNLDHALVYADSSINNAKRLLGDNTIFAANALHSKGLIYYYASLYDTALEYYNKSLEIRKKLLGENHTDIAKSYNNIGIAYYEKSEYDKAIEYYFKSLKVKLELLGEKHSSVTDSYNNIGNAYAEKSEYDIALEYYNKSLEIR